jgi:rhodanese-related sulfurtransferase
VKVGFKQLVEEAEREIETLTVDQAKALVGDENVQFVDLRDIRELWREGKIPGAVHAPRGMLEFWVDPDSPYYREVFGTGKKFVFYCAAGWRSALATQQMQKMGLEPVCHIDGGFSEWKETGGPVEDVEKR